MRLAIALALCIACVGLFACGDERNASDAPAAAPSRAATALPTALPVITLTFEGGWLEVEVASTPEARAAGLSNRDALPLDAGMLFDLGTTRIPGFWMKDTRLPLDMIWVDDARTIVEVTADVQPQPGVPAGDLVRHSPSVPVRYVLEVNAGTAARLGLEPGDRLEFSLPGE